MTLRDDYVMRDQLRDPLCERYRGLLCKYLCYDRPGIYSKPGPLFLQGLRTADYPAEQGGNLTDRCKSGRDAL